MLTRIITGCLCVLYSFSITSCTEQVQDGAPLHGINVANISNPTPIALPKSKYGNPTSYTINNKRYWVLTSAKNYNKTGIASWYGTKFHGRLTSSREVYDMRKMTAASPELPIPCFVHVTNLENNKTIIVKVNDRGPFAENRIIDLSYAAAKKIGMVKKGTALVRVSSIDIEQKINTREPKLYIQAGAFSSFSNAQKRQEKLQTISNIPVRINYNKHDKLYRVQIGAIKNVKTSDHLIEKIHFEAPKIRPFSVVF